jgi:uncharacterized protein (DUF2062 family)
MRKTITKFFQQFFTLRDTPHHIAGGFALSLFLGILPVESIFSPLLLAFLFKFNRTATLIGIAFTNFWAMVAMLPVATVVGGFLFGRNPFDLANEFHQIYGNGLGYFFTKESLTTLTLPLFAGYVVVSAVISLTLYFFVYFILKKRQNMGKMELKFP